MPNFAVGQKKKNRELLTELSFGFLTFEDLERKKVKQNRQKTAMSSFTVAYGLKTQIDRKTVYFHLSLKNSLRLE